MLRSIPLLAFGGLLFVGCGGDEATGPDELSAVDAGMLVESLLSIRPFKSADRSNQASCPDGGTVTYRQFLSSGNGSLVLSGGLDLNACGSRSASSQKFVIDGALEISWRSEFDAFGRITSQSGSLSGDLSWKKGDRAGECALSLQFKDAASTYRVTGTACGNSIDQQGAVW